MVSDPERVVKSIVIIKSSPGLFLDHLPFFQNDLKILEYDTYLPCIIFLGQCENRARCYSLNLEDFITKAWVTPRIGLMYSFEFTDSPVSDICKHPLLPVVMLKQEKTRIYRFDCRGNNTTWKLLSEILSTEYFNWLYCGIDH